MVDDANAGRSIGSKLAVAVLRHARSRQDGEMLFRRLREPGRDQMLQQDLGMGETIVKEVDVEEAYRRCAPHWEKSFLQDVNHVVHHVMERCTSMMEADNHFRSMQPMVGRELPHGGRLTEAVINEARSKCHNFWSRVTPGNVALIMQNITSKCQNWESADKKFAWLWSKGEWQADGTALVLSKLKFSLEDLEEAERQCRRKFGQPAQRAGSRKPPPRVGQASAAAAAKEASPKAPKAAPGSSNDAGAAAHPSQSNADFLVEHILRKCDDKQAATKFFNWLRSKPGTQAKGRTFSVGDISQAEQKCDEIWAQRAAVANESSSSASSDSEPARAQGARAAAARKNKKAEEKTRLKKSNLADDKLSNVDAIVNHILEKAPTIGKAEKIKDKLAEKVGQKGPLGRILTSEELVEAFKKVKEVFEEAVRSAAKPRRQASAAAGGGSGSEDDDGESSSSSNKPRKKGRPQRTKSGQLKRTASMDLVGVGGLKRQKTKKAKGLQRRQSTRLMDDAEYEGALFGSDSEDLSGEEAVDAEEEGDAPELLSGLVKDDDQPVALDDGYDAAAWAEESADVLPGFEGFNKRATAVMQKVGIGEIKLEVHFDTQAACPPLQPHQESVGFLMHPQSPVKKLLVDHPTGSGKTREMIKVLDNYFFDPRPKVPIFPKDPVCRNFYAELLRWPSRYRDYFCCMQPVDAKTLTDCEDWKERRFHMWDIGKFGEEELRRLCYRIREVLEMKGMFYMGRLRKECRVAFSRNFPGEFMPRSPLRALGYTSAGGAYSSIGESGAPMSAIMKIGYMRGSGNVYSNKIVLMDEAHNLVRTQTQYAEQLQRLRDLLFAARNLVLAGFTGTPILNEPNEGRLLLDIIKGFGAPEGDEGFLSSFPMRPRPLFPKTLPRGLPDGVLTQKRRRELIRKVELHGEALKIYEEKRRSGLSNRRLRAYCNVCSFFGSFHEGRSGSKTKILKFPEDCCPKFAAVAAEVLSSTDKAVILTSRVNGYLVMHELMKNIAAEADPPFGVASLDELAEYNSVSNLRGEKYRVLVADAAQCSEGVSFMAVRRTLLCDVPVSPSAFIQQCGRAIRMYGHRGLGDGEQVVETTLYVATLPKWMRTGEALGCWALRAQKKHGNAKLLEKKGRQLTARLNRAGIRTLAELKSRIEAHGMQRRLMPQGTRPPEGMVLTTEDVISFLEQNGVWEEARLLRAAEKKEVERTTATTETRAAIEKAVEESSRFGTFRSITLASLDSAQLDDPDVDPEQRDEASDEDGLAKALGEVMEEAGFEAGVEADEKEPARMEGEAVEEKHEPSPVKSPEAMEVTEVEQGEGVPEQDEKMEEETTEAKVDEEHTGEIEGVPEQDEKMEEETTEAKVDEEQVGEMQVDDETGKEKQEEETGGEEKQEEETGEEKPEDGTAEKKPEDEAEEKKLEPSPIEMPVPMEVTAKTSDSAGATQPDAPTAQQGSAEQPGPAVKENPRLPLQILDEAISAVTAMAERSNTLAQQMQAEGADKDHAVLAEATVQEEERGELYQKLVEWSRQSLPVLTAMKVSGCDEGLTDPTQLPTLQAELIRIQRLTVLSKALYALGAAKEIIDKYKKPAVQKPTHAEPAQQQSQSAVAEAADGDAGAAAASAAPAQQSADGGSAPVSSAEDPVDAMVIGSQPADLVDAAVSSSVQPAVPTPMDADPPSTQAGPVDVAAEAPAADADPPSTQLDSVDPAPHSEGISPAQADTAPPSGFAEPPAVDAADAASSAPKDVAPETLEAAVGADNAQASVAESAQAPGTQNASASTKPEAKQSGPKAAPLELLKIPEAEEEAWRSRLAEGGLADVLHSEAVTTVVHSIAPHTLFGPPEKGLLTISAIQVLNLFDALTKTRAKEESSIARPRALVRAMQALFSAANLEEATLTLSMETADEEALRQLEERSREFAPALTAMRSLAVDHEVMAHLADELEDDDGELYPSESEASDLDKELSGTKETAAVVLPDGWSMEWVKRKKKEAREFLDPAGKRYYNVREVRVAIEQWKQAEEEKEARMKAEAAFAEAAKNAPKRTRLTKKTTLSALQLAAEETLEAALEETLGEAFGDSLLEAIKEAPVEAASSAPTLLAVQAGALVELKDLVVGAALNGRMGRLVRYIEEIGKWECILDIGETVNVKPINFEVRGPPLKAKPRGAKRGTAKQSPKKRAAPAAEAATEEQPPAQVARTASQRQASTATGQEIDSD